MATESRTGVLGGNDITLRVLVLDDNGCPRDADTLPEVYIYDASIDSDLILEELDAATFTSAESGPITATRINTGYYEITYSVPSGSTEGAWHDVWVGSLDTASIANIRSFRVVAGATFITQALVNNQFVTLELDESIASIADATKTLEYDTLLSFTTVYTPFYASCELVRMEGGPLIEYIPDDTLALMIHWASREVDAIKPRKVCGDKFPYWRTKFVVADVALRAAMLPGGAYVHGLSAGYGDSKELGELSITKSKQGPTNSLSGGLDAQTYKALKDIRDELWRMVNAGGCINPGQSLGFTGALRGIFDPARRPAGRLWASPDEFPYSQPTTNTKVRRVGQRMHRLAQSQYRPRHSRNRSSRGRYSW